MSDKKSYGWAYPLILLGGLAIGVYFIWQWLQKSPLAPVANTITNTIEKIKESQYVIDKTTQGISQFLTNPATGQTPSIMPPSIFTPLNPVMATKPAIDLLTAGANYMVGTGIKTTANVIGATSSPGMMEALKNVFLNVATGGLISPPIEKKTIISSPQGTYVATSPIVGINWQTTSILSQPVKDVLTALQNKTFAQMGYTTQPVGTRIVATNMVSKTVDMRDTTTGVVTKETYIVPKTTVSAPIIAPKPVVPIAPVLTSVVSQPSYIKTTLTGGSGAYAKPGGM